MKIIFKLVFFLLVFTIAKAQVPPGTPTVNAPSSWYKIGWIQGENGLIHANKDTNAYVPRFAGTTVYRPIDGKLYYFDSTQNKWQKLSIGSDVPINIATTSLTATGNWSQNWNNKQLIFNNITDLGFFSSKVLGGGTRNNNIGTPLTNGLQLESYIINGGLQNVNILGLGNVSLLGKEGAIITSSNIGNTDQSYLFVTYADTPRVEINKLLRAKSYIEIGNVDNGLSTDSFLVLGSDKRVKKIAPIQANTAINNTNIGTGVRVLSDPSTQTLRTINNSSTILWDSISNINGLTAKVDTSVIATQYDLTQVPIPNLEQVTTAGSTYSTPHTIIQGSNNITYTSTGGFHNFDSLKIRNRYTGAYENITKFISNNQDSLVVLAGVMRGIANPSRSDSLDWFWIVDNVHSTQNIPSIPIQFRTNLSTGQVTIYYPINNYKVVSLMFGPDEQLINYGVNIGASVDPDSAQVFATMPYTNGGYGYWNGSSWVNLSDPGGSITDNASTGLINLPIKTIKTTTDQARQAFMPVVRGVATFQTGTDRPVVDPFATSGTSLAIYMLDMFGDAIRSTNRAAFTGFQGVGITSYNRLNLCQQTGSNAWQKNVFNPLSNIWVIGVFKKAN